MLLADDHKIVREGLASLLRTQPQIEVVAEACDGQMAVEMTRQLNPDIVLMDVSMPRLNGVEATARIVAEVPRVRIIGLSMHPESDMARAMCAAGAAAYLSKSADPETVIETICQCAYGQSENSPALKNVVADPQLLLSYASAPRMQ